MIKNAAASSAGETKDATRAAKAAEEVPWLHRSSVCLASHPYAVADASVTYRPQAAAIVDAAVFPDDEPEPGDTNLSQPLSHAEIDDVARSHPMMAIDLQGAMAQTDLATVGRTHV